MLGDSAGLVGADVIDVAERFHRRQLFDDDGIFASRSTARDRAIVMEAGSPSGNTPP